MSVPSAAAEPKRTRLGLPYGLRFSLAESFLVAIYACVGIAAAKAGGLLAWLFAETTIVLAVAFVVAAIFAHGVARAFAVGFVIGVAAHAFFLIYFGAGEFEPDEAKLPYSKIVAPVWTALEPKKFVSLMTGNEIRPEDVQSAWTASGQAYLTTRNGGGVEFVERPSGSDFMLVAHAFGAAGAGYLMGKLAAVFCRRRERTAVSTGAAT